MNIKRSLKAVLAACVCLLPLRALAQSSSDETGFDVGDKPTEAAAMPAPTNWITIGGDYQSNRAYYLDRYRGGVDPGFHGLGDFQYSTRDAWDSGGTKYFNAEGHDLGYEDRSFIMKFGEQGTWGASLYYDGIPYFATDRFDSVWNTSGGLVPGYTPRGLGSGITFQKIAPAVTSLGYPYPHGVAGPAIWQPVYTNAPAGLLYNYDLSTQRDIFGATGKWQWQDWTITGAIRHEHKTGYQANSLNVTGTPSATSSSAAAPTTYTSALGYFAMPIDYDTDRYDITAAYGNPRLQVQAGYTFSNFTDNLPLFDAAKPYIFTGTTFGTPAQMAGLNAPYTLPPSNSAHQVRLMLGYNLSPTWRVNANFAYGLQLQNAPYEMNSGNPAATLTEPRGSLDGLVQTVFGNIATTMQPLPRTDLRLSYTIDDHDNQTPHNVYEENHNSLAVVAPGVYANLPFSFEHQTISAEAGYRILPQTKVTLSDSFEIMNRTYADTSLVTTNTVTAKVRSQIIEDVFASLSYSHQDRNAQNYVNNETWTLLGDTARDPLGYMLYFEASRKRDEIKYTMDVSPTQALTTTLMVKYANDTYPDGSLGLRNNHNLSVGPDVNWQVSPAVNAHAFYTFQQIYYDQNSLYESSTTSAPTATSFVAPWTQNTTDTVHTVGVTLDWAAIKDVLKFSVDYNFSYGDTAYALGDGIVFFGSSVTGSQITQANLNPTALPDVTSMLNMVQIRGEYTFRPNMSVVFGYAYEHFTYKDFMAGINSTQYANLLLPGTPNYNESVHIIGAGMRIRF